MNHSHTEKLNQLLKRVEKPGRYIGGEIHSVNIDFKTEDERLTAAQKTAMLWNTGKVIKSEPGE